MNLPEECLHENVRTFRSIPAHSKCLDCGAVVERRWFRTVVPPFS